jgi:hypothetical protein
MSTAFLIVFIRKTTVNLSMISVTDVLSAVTRSGTDQNRTNSSVSMPSTLLSKLLQHRLTHTTISCDNISESLPNPISDSSNVFIWSLSDIRKPEEPRRFLINYPCLPVQTASPNSIRYKTRDKERTPLHTGFPLWSRDKLAQG